MNVKLDAFPVLSRNLLGKTGYSSAENKYAYEYQGTFRELKAPAADTSTTQSVVYKLTDEKANMWHPQIYNLLIRYKSEFKNPSVLFGENGLAAQKGGIIGVALIWTNQEGGQRGAEELGELTYKSSFPSKIEKTVEFPAGILRGILQLQTVLYLKRQGEPEGKECYQASVKGTLLGELEKVKIIIDGNGSLFPISEVSDSKKPLWWASCDWEDPLTDTFTYDNFCLYINKAHPDYASVNVNGGLRNSPLLLEIISTSLGILIMKVLSDETIQNEVVNGIGLQSGTVASYVNYLLHTFDFTYDKSSPEDLAYDIRKALETRLKVKSND